MGTAILLGIPKKYLEATKSALGKNALPFTGWAIKFIPSSGTATGVLRRDTVWIQRFAEDQENIHIVGFSDDQNRQTIADLIAPYFRFRWFRYELLRCLGSPNASRFVDQLAVDLAEEAAWAARVKPADVGSPLLLPECAFKPGRRHTGLWRHALAYGDMQNVVGAEKAIVAFRATHYRKLDAGGFSRNTKHTWIDEGNRVFDKDGPRHGLTPYPRNWKYSFRIEEGFHFDVTHLDRQRFFVQDANGNRNPVKAGGYKNIDPHGYAWS